MKKIKIILISVLSSFSVMMTASAATNAAPITLNASVKSAIVVDANTGQILGQKNATQLVPIASQSKMLTAYAVLRAIQDKKLHWNDKVTITKKSDLSQQPKYLYSHLDVQTGDKLTVRELYDAMLTISANDAAFALSEYLTPKGQTTQQALQSWAKKLHLTGSKWYNAAGQDNSDAFENKITTAADDAANMASAQQVAVIARQLVKLDPTIRDLAKKNQISYHNHNNQLTKVDTEYARLRKETLSQLSNPNELTIEGLKTGSTPVAGAAFTGLIKDKSGHEFITVINGAGDYTNTVRRYQETINVVNEVLKAQHPTTYTAGQKISKYSTVTLKEMKKKEMPAVLATTKTFWTQSATTIATKFHVNTKLGNHVNKNQVIGTVKLSLTGEQFLPTTSQADKTLSLVATQKTSRANWFVRVWRQLFD